MSRFTSLRAAIAATVIAAAVLATSVASVLAGGNNGPFPR